MFFMEEFLGADIWGTQRDILESVRDHRYTAVPSCHSSGKSFIAARVVLWFLYAFFGAKVITTAPTTRQVEGILWPEIHSARSHSIRPLGGDHNMLQIWPDKGKEPDWYAMGFTAPDYDPNRFQGFHADHILVVVDEAAGVTEPISDQIASLLAGGHPRRLDIGNPVTAGSPFQKACDSPLTRTIHISAFDTPNFTELGITGEDFETDAWSEKQGAYLETHEGLPRPQLITPEWVAERHAIWGANSEAWRTRILGQFPEVVKGSYYGELLQAADAEGRIGEEPHDAEKPVYTAWDIGVSDSTAIWFGQWKGEAFRLIDYYEDVGQGATYYAGVLSELARDRGYQYATPHIAPHDFKAREWSNADSIGRAKSAVDTMAGLGYPFRVLGKLRDTARGEILEGIDIARRLLPKCRFDEKRCQDGLDGLRNYKRAVNSRTGEPVVPERPEHNWASHPADAFRYLAIGLMQKRKVKRPKANTKWIR